MSGARVTDHPGAVTRRGYGCRRETLDTNCLRSLFAIVLVAGRPRSAPVAGLRYRSPEIVGGVEVTAGDYPFMAALVWRGVPNAKNGLRCGATMLDAEWFLTAAHCAEGYTAA